MTADPLNSPPSSSEPPPSACPVNHQTRLAWLATAPGSPNSSQFTSRPTDSATTNSPTTTQTCSSSTLETNTVADAVSTFPNLSTRRQVSSIPRAIATIRAASGAADEGEGLGGGNLESANAEINPSGNWIYPSEAMFFAAMRRKNWDPKAEDMRTIVPIHNAVNERAWKEIKYWENGRGSEECGGPKLISFSGDSTRLTPKAWLRCLLGYTAPFDRHDWVVDRCGKQIEYVIDFYSGKKDPKRPDAVSFYLDVRPKINSFEGAWMRVSRPFSTLWQ